jgi:hypothetical protein
MLLGAACANLAELLNIDQQASKAYSNIMALPTATLT